MNFFDDVFWPEWPDKQNKKLSRAACERALKRGASEDKIMVGARAYKAGKPDWKDWMHATTFFNGDRWEDEQPKPVIEKSYEQRRRESEMYYYVKFGEWTGASNSKPTTEEARAYLHEHGWENMEPEALRLVK